MGIGTIKVVTGVLVAALALSAAIARAENVPPDFRLYKNLANVRMLARYDDVSDRNRIYASQPRGFVKFSDGSYVPTGWGICLSDSGEKPSNHDPCEPFYPGPQPIGMAHVWAGTYDFGNYPPPGRVVFGDHMGTTEDEGARIGERNYSQRGEDIIVLAISPDGRIYEAEFVELAPLREFGYFQLRTSGDKKK